MTPCVLYGNGARRAQRTPVLSEEHTHGGGAPHASPVLMARSSIAITSWTRALSSPMAVVCSFQR